MKKILLIIAHNGFQPLEYNIPKKILETSDFEVVVGSDAVGTATASDNTKTEVDLSLKDVKVEDYSGIFFIGGSGALEHLDNTQSYRLVREADTAKILFGAICISPRILAHAGVLSGRKVTGWDEDSELSGILAGAGAEYVREPVVVDNNLITANGPTAAEEFGNGIVGLLS